MAVSQVYARSHCLFDVRQAALAAAGAWRSLSTMPESSGFRTACRRDHRPWCGGGRFPGQRSGSARPHGV